MRQGFLRSAPEDTWTQPTCDKGENAFHEGSRLAGGILAQPLGRAGVEGSVPSVSLHRPSCPSSRHAPLPTRGAPSPQQEGPNSALFPGLDTPVEPPPR